MREEVAKESGLTNNESTPTKWYPAACRRRCLIGVTSRHASFMIGYYCSVEVPTVPQKKRCGASFDRSHELGAWPELNFYRA